MGVPASALRRLMARAAKTALSEGMAVRAGIKEGDVMRGPLAHAMMRSANLSDTTERGYNQLNRLKALLEGLADKSRENPNVRDHIKHVLMLGQLSQVNDAVDQGWRKMMGG